MSTLLIAFACLLALVVSSAGRKPDEAAQAAPSTGGLFSGISLTKPAQKQNVVSFASLTQQPTTAGAVTSQPAKPAAAAAKTNGATPKPELKELNENFLNWLERHLARKPVSIWKEAMQDYIQYAKELVPADEDEAEAPAKAPAPQAKPPTTLTAFNAGGAAKEETTPAAAAAVGAPKTDFKFSGFAGANKPAPAPAPAPGPAPARAAAAPAAADAKPAAQPFSFGFTKPAAEAPSKPAPAPTPGPAPTPAPASGFSGFKFGSSLMGAGSTTVPAPAANGVTKPSAFAFTGTPSFGAKPAAAAAAEGGEEGGEGDDEDAMPYEAPAEVLKNEADKDEILHEVDCKLFKLVEQEEDGKTTKEWKDLGKGTFQIARDPDTGKTRMLVRNQLGKVRACPVIALRTGQNERNRSLTTFCVCVSLCFEQPTLNAYLLSGQKFTKKGKNIMFSAPVGGTTLQGYMLKVKPEHVDETIAKLERYRPSS